MFNADTFFMLVDDSNTTRSLLADHLFSLGFKNFCHASDGDQAWKILSSPNVQIGVILCDWNMPNMSGMELLKKIKSDPILCPIPFIMVTSERNSESVRQAVEAGVSNYIVKPFDVDVIREKLERTFQALAKRAA